MSRFLTNMRRMPRVIRRYFTELASAGSQHYTIAPVTLSGDFEIEFDVYSSESTGVTNPVIGGSSDLVWYIRDGSLWAQIPSASGMKWRGIAFTANTLVHCKVGRSGDTYYFETDQGYADISVPGYIDDDIIYIGRWLTGYTDSIISNVKITDNGTLIRHYPLNESWTNPGSQGVAGSDVTTNGGFELWSAVDTPDHWIRSHAHTGSNFVEETLTGLRLVSDGAFVGLTQTSTLEVGEYYEIEVKNLTRVSGNITITSGAGLQTLSSDGDHIFVLQAQDTTLGLKRTSGVTDLSFDSISVKKLTGYIPATDSDVVINKAATLGGELVTNGTFDSDLSNWTVNSEDATNTVTWNAGSVHIVGDGGAALHMLQPSVFTIGKTYLLVIHATVNAGNIGGIKLQYFGSDASIGTVTETGIHYFVFTPNTTTLEVFRKSAVATNVTISNISIKEAPGYGTAVNITSADAEQFTQIDAGWLGAELVTNGGFDTDTGWTKGAGWTISGGKAIGVGLDSPAKGLSQLGVFTAGQRVLFSYEGVLDTGSFSLQDGSSLIFTPNGDLTPSRVSVSLPWTPNTTLCSMKRFAEVDNITLDNISAKRLLEVAQ